MEENKKTLLITGSTGFIGKNLVEQFKNKYNLLTPSHKELELVDSEGVDKYFEEHKIDVVVHAATLGGRRIKEDIQENIFKKNLQMFFNILKNSNKYKKLINFGAAAEYNRRYDIKKVREEDCGKHMPRDDYDLSKYIMSKYIENAKENVINLRLFAVFGKYEDYELRFISNAICKILLGLPIVINQNVFFDYIYIKDVVKIIEHFIENDSKEKVFNVGTANPIDLVSLADKINEIAEKKIGKKTEIMIKQEGLNKELSCNNSRLISEIPGFQFTPIEQAIEELIDYYKNNLNNLDMSNLIADKYNK